MTTLSARIERRLQLAKALRACREKMNLSVIEVAYLINVGTQAIYQHEKGAASPSIEAAGLYAVLYGIDLNAYLSPCDEDIAEVTKALDYHRHGQTQRLAEIEEEFQKVIRQRPR